MKRAQRTPTLPPWMERCFAEAPLSLLNGASPARLAGLFGVEATELGHFSQ
ncbi:MAG: hypothetical protein WDO24_03915 [Pseudomonadota bacterium]